MINPVVDALVGRIMATLAEIKADVKAIRTILEAEEAKK